MKYLILLLVCFTQQALAGDGSSFVAGGTHACIIDGGQVKCWGYEISSYLPWGLFNIPALKNPKQLSAAGERTCALDDEGVKCWGSAYYNEYGQSDTKLLNKPVKKLMTAREVTCVLYEKDQGVECWGNNLFAGGQKHFGQAIDASINSDSICLVRWDGTVDCQDRLGNDIVRKLPKFTTARQVSLSDFNACVLDDKGVTCWGEENLISPPLHNPRQVFLNNKRACALDGNEIICWSLWQPTWSANAQNFAPGEFYSCGINIGKIECWGEFKEFYEKRPIPTLDFGLFNYLKMTVSTARANCLAVLENGQNKNKWLRSSPEFYFLMALASPIVQSWDSEVYVNGVSPEFKDFFSQQSPVLGYSSVEQGFNKTPDNTETRTVALDLIQAILSTSRDFISMDQQNALQDAIRATGVALAAPMDAAGIQNLIQKLDTLTTEKQKLKSSSKSSFLVDTLELAANWLREKVK